MIWIETTMGNLVKLDSISAITHSNGGVSVCADGLEFEILTGASREDALAPMWMIADDYKDRFYDQERLKRKMKGENND